MTTTEPEDARPDAPVSDKTAARLARLEQIRLRNFRTGAHIVGFNISEDFTEVWARGFAKPHYPMAGARATVKDHGAYIVLTAPTYELAIEVPKGARKRAERYAAEFNTFQMNRRD